MTVSELFAEPVDGLTAEVPSLLASREVRGLALDSRKVRSGDLFFALPGRHQDGGRFAQEALGRGAIAVVLERSAAGPDESVIEAAIRVSQPRRALAFVAARFHHHPDRRLALVGITGTNGKTTTALLVAAIAEAAGEAPGFIGTLGSRIASEWDPGVLTTPEAPELCDLLERMVRAGVKHCAMEVSSHALSQDRVSGLTFAAAGFTHLTRDHLDFHGTIEAYYLAKRRLFFELLRPEAPAVVNADDAFGGRLAGELSSSGRPVARFGRGAGVELHITEERLSLEGSAFTLQLASGPLPIRSPLIGAHNVENLALAVGLGQGVGFSHETIARGLAALTAVPGRLERVEPADRSLDPKRRSPLGFVDYAHTDDALSRVLAALRSLGAAPPRRLLLVFGCGGERDPGKRPLMGRAAALGADLVVATSDNPRGEDPDEILRQIVPGLAAGGKSVVTEEAAQTGAAGYLVESDRRAAIRLAVSLARPEDVLLVAGKGHETTQTIGSQKLPFDDRAELRAALERRAA